MRVLHAEGRKIMLRSGLLDGQSAAVGQAAATVADSSQGVPTQAPKTGSAPASADPARAIRGG